MFKRLQKWIIFVFLTFIYTLQCCNTKFAVEQCPGTDVSNIRRQTEFSEISLIFYYTQWSDESLEALQQFNDVAAYFKDKVYFAAINCWHLSCNCSKTLSTTVGSGSPHKWPTLIVHYGRIGHLKIQYNGLFTFRDMVQFIINVMQPLDRIEGTEELENMIPLTDAIVLGEFAVANIFEYKHYLMAALKWLEHDPIRAYRFTVKFNSFEDRLNKTNLDKPNLLLLGHKTKKSFANYSDFNWNVSNILRWLHEEFNNDYSQLYSYSTPITISQKIKRQPVLAIFVNAPQQFFLHMEQYADYQLPFTKAILACKSLKKRNAIKDRMKSLQFFKIVEYLKNFNENSKCHSYDKDDVLKNLNFYYEINQYFEFYDDYVNSKHRNMEVQELLSFFQYAECLPKKDIASQITFHVSVIKKLENYFANEQQSKSSNRSLSVVLLDTQRYKDFLENIDISPTHRSIASVFIIDNDKESTYVMENRFSVHNLMDFVKKFYSNALNSYNKNEHIAAKQSSYTLAPSRNYDFKLNELNRNMFLNYLHNFQNQTLIVLIYSPDCALCGNIQHSFMQLSLSLRRIDHLKFIRINIMDNDLPWQFNMPFVPALLVFPENRFSESRLFPAHLKPSMQNVFGFILSQLSAQHQIKLVLTMCQSGSLTKKNTQSCWQLAKTILMQHIGKHLQYWQMFEAERSLILERLRAFKDMSLDIQRNLRL